jgi:hypothetical protein
MHFGRDTAFRRLASAQRLCNPSESSAGSKMMQKQGRNTGIDEAAASNGKRAAWVEPEITAMKLASAAVVTIPVGP